MNTPATSALIEELGRIRKVLDPEHRHRDALEAARNLVGVVEALRADNARLREGDPGLLAAAKRLVAVALEDRPEQWAEATVALERAIAKAEGS